MSSGVEVTLKPTAEIIAARGLLPGGRAQQYIDSEVLRLAAPYVPFRTGMLRNSGIAHTNIGSGVVVWSTPYARTRYYSSRAVGSSTGPLRGSYWFERMKSAHGRQILQGAAKIAGGRV